MNIHEAERIANAINVLRPDWPVASLRTLLGRPELTRRPRRDVLVALAWVAAEPESQKPYRVLESGPWWAAAAAEHARPATEAPEIIPPEHQCAICSRRREDCARNPHGGHEFRSVVEHARTARQPDAEAAHLIADAIRAEVESMTPRQPTTRTEQLIAERVEQHTNAACEATAHGKHGRAEYEAARADLLDAGSAVAELRDIKATAMADRMTPTEEDQ